MTANNYLMVIKWGIIKLLGGDWYSGIFGAADDEFEFNIQKIRIADRK